ncbi:hypothetical protein DPMN_165461 [Dreissena polymorpha]|uniref:Uncharacterized protein n=1 Tax=Dreissena polymorpha TaxID=45954 RepID=A0A9D4IX09_DREPO|nr:hypothetical protein DPMN_165461 [Dreissena polymorpha]
MGNNALPLVEKMASDLPCQYIHSRTIFFLKKTFCRKIFINLDLTEEDVWRNDLKKESVKCMSLRADKELFALIAFYKDKDPESSDFLEMTKCLLDDCPKDFDEDPDEV